MSGGLTIRPLRGTSEYEACVALQEETWGRGFSERVPSAILQVSQILGGVAAGAWSPEGRLVGFVFGMTGLRDGVPVHWSDMLAVRPEARNHGLGRRLKMYQRAEMLARGVTVMHWTFDPLRARNAHLNFARLGIVAREYVRDMYGDTDSPLHRGIGTDRFVATWALDSPRVEARLAGAEAPARRAGTASPPAAVDRVPEGGDLPRPTPPDLSLGGEPAVRVVVPGDIGRIMDADPGLALAWREATRSALTHYLAEGFEAREFLRDSGAPAYLLVRRDDDGSSPTPAPPSP